MEVVAAAAVAAAAEAVIAAVLGTALTVEAARTAEAEVVRRSARRARQNSLPGRFHSRGVRTRDIG